MTDDDLGTNYIVGFDPSSDDAVPIVYATRTTFTYKGEPIVFLDPTVDTGPTAQAISEKIEAIISDYVPKGTAYLMPAADASTIWDEMVRMVRAIQGVADVTGHPIIGHQRSNHASRRAFDYDGHHFDFDIPIKTDEEMQQDIIDDLVGHAPVSAWTDEWYETTPWGSTAKAPQIIGNHRLLAAQMLDLDDVLEPSIFTSPDIDLDIDPGRTSYLREYLRSKYDSDVLGPFNSTSIIKITDVN